MMAKYMLPALRSLARDRLVSVLNILGLATAMACCIVVFLYIRHELDHDRFHKHADSVVRVGVERRYAASTASSALTPRSLAGILAEEFPQQVQKATRLSREHAERVLVQSGENMFYEDGVVFADPNVFEVFTLPLTAGSPAQALQAPRSIVITESAARKYFGGDDPLGKVLTLRLFGDGDRFEYTITAVARDLPAASHFHFDFLATYLGHPFTMTAERERPSFENPDVYTYLLLRPGVDQQGMVAGIAQAISRKSGFGITGGEGGYLSRNPATGTELRYFLQPLTDIHLRSHLADEFQPGSNIEELALVGGIACFILLLACINFANLATARSSTRALEAGMRRLLGCGRAELTCRFLAEALLLGLAALFPALVLVELLLPGFNDFAGTSLDFVMSADWYLLPLMMGFAAFTACLAGIYPSFFLAAPRPLTLLRDRARAGRSRLRNGLVVFQFAVAILLMSGTGVILAQLSFMAGSRLGFDKEQVLVLEGAEVLKNHGEAFRQAMLDVPGVLGLANGENVPGRQLGMTLVRPENGGAGAQVGRLFTGFGYAETLGLSVLQGRSLSAMVASDAMGALLNQTAVAALGLEEPVGQRLIWGNRTYTVVGVVADYHQSSLREPIAPMMLAGPDPEFENRPWQYVAVRFDTSDLPALLATLASVWKKFAPQQPFTYGFLDRQLETLYGSEELVAALAGLLACIAIFIACLGLYGLVCFNTQRRRREIGVRKVMGGSVWSIVLLLTNDFSKLVLIANIIAWPLAHYAMNSWLQHFAYRINLTPLIFIGSGATALAIAWVTVGGTAAKAANQKPVLALRYE